MKYITYTATVFHLLFATVTLGQPLANKQQQWRDEVKEKLQAANQPINFYGLIVDQANLPVKDIKIKLTNRSLVDPTGKLEDWDQDEKEYEVTSGSDGRFEFHGKGTSLDVELQRKEGYLYSRGRKKHYNFDASEQVPVHVPNTHRPVIFRVWKAQGGETVVKAEIRNDIKQDGTWMAVDLLDPQLKSADSVAADFRVSLKAEIPANARAAYKCRWSIRIEAINGDLVLTDDEYMYLAPESGYQRTLETVFDPSRADWKPGTAFKFYLRSGGGKHCARVILHAAPRPDLLTGIVGVESVINLTGSRNLEEGKVLQYLPNTR